MVQSGLHPNWWPKGTHFCTSKNIAMIDGDSCYNRRHGEGHFKGLCIPFGALVDSMPQNDIKIESFGSKTIQGIFRGYHIQPGWAWGGD